METILLTGGTGLIGSELTNHFINSGFRVHILTRNPERKKNASNISYFGWNPEKQTFDKAALENVSVLINLAGENIAAKRWTSSRKELIRKSRVDAGELVSKILLFEKHQITTLIQASATGWYNTLDQENFTDFQESLPPADDFLGKTVHDWEQSIADVQNNKIRILIVRIGIVLNKKGGMAKEMLLPLRLGVKPIFGSGKQIVPWIHQHDLNRLFHFLITQQSCQGVYNAVASPNSNQEALIDQIKKVLQRKTWLTLRIPSFLLKIILGELSVELLKSNKVYNDKIKKAGFQFDYPALENIDTL
jgi:uncharacterized protein